MTIITLSKLITIFIVLSLRDPIIFCHKRTKDPDKLRSNKLDECLRCKVLTDSFNSWLDKTSRGKHEGGDVAWEEAKLKSYARSEMRLVEIQEGLCSELKIHKDHCYALAEEAEQVLEKWWFNENYNDSDLFTWLCNENLKYCCPPYHFGEACTPCPLDKNNKICGGKGKCDGDGTRKGNGTCICKRGYSGNYCEECSPNFFNTMNMCKPCHQACNECHGQGPNACIQCAPGWSMESGVCVDVNECLDESICKASDFCINREGSYDCKPCDRTCNKCVGAGPEDCTSCKPDNILWNRKCMSSEQQKDLLKNALERAAFYLCLCILVIILVRKSWSLGCFAVLVISLVIHFFEKNSNIKVIAVVDYYYSTLR